MIDLKNKDEISKIREGGRRLSLVMEEVLKAVKPGVRLVNLDKKAEELIEKYGGQPSFKTVKNYHWATCINLNAGVVHGIPGQEEIKEGDIVSLDMGMLYQGFHTDMARTLCAGASDSKLEKKFLNTGRMALKKAIQEARPGQRVGHISKAIEATIRAAGFSPVEALTGHGVGRKLHELPAIPCFLSGSLGETEPLEPGMVLAIEVIYNLGAPEVVIKEDGWTVETKDGQISALFEDTVVINKTGSEILTAN